MRASFSIAWKISRAKAPHTAGKNLIKPAAVEMARTLFSNSVANKLAMMLLSNDMIKRRIREISKNALQQMIAAVKCRGKFSLQLEN